MVGTTVPPMTTTGGEQVSGEDLAATAGMLRRTLDAIDAGELTCSRGYRARLQGAVVALGCLTAGDSVTGSCFER